MALTETKLIDRINRRIHNAKGKLGGDTEMRNILNDALRFVRLDIDLPGAKRVGSSFLIFDDVFEYPLPSDIDYDKTIQILPEEESFKNQIWERVALKYFHTLQNPISPEYAENNWILNSSMDRTVEENRNRFAIDFEDSVPYMLLRSNIGDQGSAQIASTTTPTDDGTWTAGDDATNVRTDTQTFKTNSSCVAFDSAGVATDVSISNSTFTAVDLSSYEDLGVLFVWVFLPSTLPTTVTLYWGSSDAAYWSKAETTRQNGLSFKAGWNLLSFNWAEATETGAPDDENIDYLKLTLTNSAATALTEYRIDKIYARLGREIILKHYSKFLVKSTTGTRKEEFTASSDTTILEGQEVDLIIDKGAEIASGNLRELKELGNHQNNYNYKKQLLESKFPSETDIESMTYYRM